jgi:hypothetical protein
MSETIHKFPFVPDDSFNLAMPQGSIILTVQVQRGQPCMWARVFPTAPKVTRRFRLFGTGHLIPPNGRLEYIGTFQLHEGALVFHLFEEVRA